MAYVAVEICCSPKGSEKYPVPTTIRIAKIFTSVNEIKTEFSDDRIIRGESDNVGQDVYYLLWKLDSPLNLDRCIQKDNVISNCGMWLSDSQRLYADGADIAVELVPNEKLQQRARQKEAVEKASRRLKQAVNAHRNTEDYQSAEQEAFGDSESHHRSRRRNSSSAGRFARTRGGGGTPWNKFA